MRTVHFRSLSGAAAALLILAGIATAQDTPDALLNTLEVRQLVAWAEPADHARPEPGEKDLTALAAKASTPAEHKALEEYFLTLAKRYTTTANEHVTLARAYRGTKIAQASAMHDHLARTCS